MLHSTALLIIGFGLLSVQMVMAAPHCVKKPVVEAANCSIKLTTSIQTEDLVFAGSLNVTCNPDPMWTISFFNLDYIHANGTSLLTQYALKKEDGLMWFNIQCVKDITPGGSNFMQAAAIPTGGRLDKIACYTSSMTIEQFKEKPGFPGGRLDWTPEVNFKK